MSNLNYETQGQIIAVDETQIFASGFQKREFVIKVEDGKYPQDIKFEVVKDNCEGLDQYRRGDTVRVKFNIRGNEYNGKYYVNLSAWRIETLEMSKRPGQASRLVEADNGHETLDSEMDDIPF
jgi:single-strand DNA-binding protein